MAMVDTFKTKDPQIVADCCNGMRLGAEVAVYISGIRIAGFVKRIELMDDGQHRIAVRLTQ